MIVSKKLQSYLLTFAIWWIISVISLSLIIEAYLQMEFAGNILGAVFLFGLLFGLIGIGIKKGRFHFGHLPFLFGLFFVIAGGGLLYGSLDAPDIDKVKWWDIPNVEHRVYLAVLFIFGVVLIIIVAKTIGKNWWFMRPLGRGGK